MCIEIYQFDPAKYRSVPELAWQAALKKAKVKLDLVTDINMLLMGEKGIRGGISLSIYRDANNKQMKNYSKNKESLHLPYWNVNNLYGWAMSQKFPRQFSV